MKVIKIELHDVPNNYGRPVVEMIKYPKINPKIFIDTDTLTYDQTDEVVKEIYPLLGLALGRYQDWFYVREKDKDALEEIFKGFINKAQVALLEELIAYGENKPSGFWDFLQEKKKMLEAEDKYDQTK